MTNIINTNDNSLGSILALDNSADNQNITNLATPVNAFDAANKAYVDSEIGTSTTLAQVLSHGSNANNLSISNLASLSTAIIDYGDCSIQFFQNPDDTFNMLLNSDEFQFTSYGPIGFNGIIQAQTGLTMTNNTINNVGAGVADQDAVNVTQLNTAVSSLNLSSVLNNGNSSRTHSINMNNNKITSLANGTVSTDAVNLGQLNSSIGTTNLSNTLINGNSAGSNSINMNNNKITSISNGTNPGDSVNFSQLTTTNNQVTTNTTNIATNTSNITTNAATMNAHILNGNNPHVTTFQQVLAANNLAGVNQVNMNNNKIINLANGTISTDAINLSQLTGAISGSNLSSVLTAGNSAGSTQINMNSNKIINLSNGSASGDGINYSQLSATNTTVSTNQTTMNNHISNVSNPHSTSLTQALVISNSAGSNTINMNSNKITSLANGSATTDACAYGQLLSGLGSMNLSTVLANGNTASTNIILNSNNINSVNEIDADTVNPNVSTYVTVNKNLLSATINQFLNSHLNFYFFSVTTTTATATTVLTLPQATSNTCFLYTITMTSIITAGTGINTSSSYRRTVSVRNTAGALTVNTTNLESLNAREGTTLPLTPIGVVASGTNVLIQLTFVASSTVFSCGNCQIIC